MARVLSLDRDESPAESGDESPHSKFPGPRLAAFDLFVVIRGLKELFRPRVPPCGIDFGGRVREWFARAGWRLGRR